MSNLSEAIQEMRNMQQAYDQLAQSAEAYNVGKTQLAQAITGKGVETSPTETYPEMAEKVSQIPLVTTEIDGGEMYAAQSFGDANPAQSPLWNLYDVLAEMKTRFMGTGQYAALIVCEYYKSEKGVSYPSLQLQGADAYYTCDGDLYETSAPLHVWHDTDDGRTNRWVCFLFATAGARLDITNTAISPRSMYIGGHIGTIEYFVNGRLTELVCGVESTDIVDNFLQNGYSQSFQACTILHNIKNFAKITTGSYKLVQINADTDVQSMEGLPYSLSCSAANSVIVTGIKKITLGTSGNTGDAFITYGGADPCPANSIEIIGTKVIEGTRKLLYLRYNKLNRLSIKDLEKCPSINVDFYGGGGDLIDFTVGQMKTNLYFNLWNPTNVLADADKKAQLIDNIKNHILARISDATGGTQLVFTVKTNMYNAIASETITWNDEEMTLADAFLTKNWLLAGA